MQITVNGAGLCRPRRAQMVSVPLLAVATRAAASLPALLRRGGLLAAITTIGTALGPVAAGLCRGLGTSLGLPACEPAAEAQAPPQPFPRVPGKPHRCLTPSLPRPPWRHADEVRSPYRNSSRQRSYERAISIKSSEEPCGEPFEVDRCPR